MADYLCGKGGIFPTAFFGPKKIKVNNKNNPVSLFYKQMVNTVINLSCNETDAKLYEYKS